MTVSTIKLRSIASKIEYHTNELNRLRSMLPDINYNRVIELCCDTLGISAYLLESKSKKANVSECRMIIAKELREFGFSLQSIGLIMSRHHSSIVYSLNKYNDLYQYDAAFRIKADCCAAVVNAEYEPEKIHLSI